MNQTTSTSTQASGDFRSMLSDMTRIVRPAVTQQAGSVTLYIGVYLLASFVSMLSLVSFNNGFRNTGVDGESGNPAEWAIRMLDMLGIPENRGWIVFFTGFFLLSLLAAAIDHLGWIIRLRLLSRYEISQVIRGLELIMEADPRDRAEFSPRDMLLALRGDCKSMRVVFQLVLSIVISVVQAIFPLAYIMIIDTGMSLLAVGILMLAFVPMKILTRRAGANALKQRDVAMTIGSHVAQVLYTVAARPMDRAERDEAVEGVRAGVEDQHRLWRRQYLLRSLGEKVPLSLSLFSVFVLMVYGVFQIEGGTLTWGELFTFIVAVRIVVQPFVAIGKRWTKSSERFSIARKHLHLVDAMRRDKPGDARANLDGPVETITLERLFSGPDGQTPIDIELRRGSVLSIIDSSDRPEKNSLLTALMGRCYIANGSIRFNDCDLNGLSHLVISGAVDQPLIEWRTDDMGEREPDGFDTFVGAMLDEDPSAFGQRRDPQARWIRELFEVRCRGRSVVALGPFNDDGVREVCSRFVNLFRSDLIIVWLDRRPCGNLGDQTLAVFNETGCLGAGPIDWFGEHFPDWQSHTTSGPGPNNLGAIEAAEGMEDLFD